MSKIASVETFVSGGVCIVRVRTDDGLEGYGQTAPGQPAITASVLHELIVRNYLGQDPFDVAALSDACVRAEYKFLGSFLFRALSGVDTALWDLMGRATGRPVYQLLGGKVRDRIPVYGSGMRRDTSPEEETERMTRAVADFGFRCVKAKIGVRNGRDSEPSDGRTAKLVPLLRKELGDSVEISADANGAYSPAQAVRVGRLLEEYRYYHLEEPNPSWELDNMGAVAASLDIPIGAGEQEFSLEIVRRMVAERLVDVIQPDVCYIGGLTRARKVAEIADIAGIPCTPHCSNRSMVQIFTAHFVAAMPACTQFQEWSIEDQSATNGLYDPVPVPRDGFIELSDRPGWGVEIPAAFLDGATQQKSTV
jgi:L-alanine-DL-glutamate epimerase-like enolase superfamily enzyme